MNKETDRELLELAAKAIGFGQETKHGPCWTGSVYPYKSNTNGALWNYVGHGDTAELWNPLTDDGDALRLAVALEIDLIIGTGSKFVTARNEVTQLNEYEYTQDKAQAVRRAIVRAAAEIGRNIK